MSNTIPNNSTKGDIPLTSRVKRNHSKHKTDKSFENSEDLESCVICADTIVFGAYTSCQHITCHRCALRQRVLYGKDVCLVCRTPNETVIIFNQLETDYSQLKPIVNDEKYKIGFTSEEVRTESMSILDLKCVLRDCGQKFDTFKSLSDHTRQEHNKYICLICYNNKKAFIDELPLYHYKQLQTHQTIGDQKGFTGHPACRHCTRKRFYSEDELNIHIRDSHERCYICDQDNPSKADYYRDYDYLYQHFKSDHYVCSVQSCLDKKFIVFRDDLDLTAHMLKEHGNITGNSKVIYKSQLSTYQPRNGTSNSRQPQEDSFGVKKMRLEERAKHYLEYDNDKIQEFINANNQFKDDKLTADELHESYTKLFSNQTLEETLILLTELAGLYQPTNKKHTELNSTIERLTRTNDQSFPILGGTQPPINLHGWGTKSRTSSPDNFPVLQRKSQNSGSAAKSMAKPKPIRYTTIKLESKPTPTVNSFQGDPNFKPSYLESSANTPVASSSASSSNWGTTPKAKPTDLNKFPALEKKDGKKKFGRVNPITVTPASEWKPKSDSPLQEEPALIPVVDKRKKQKKQILFSNNF